MVLSRASRPKGRREALAQRRLHGGRVAGVVFAAGEEGPSVAGEVVHEMAVLVRQHVGIARVVPGNV